MAEKDIVEKTLADYNDVFADIVNVLLFGGRPVVAQEDLVDARVRSQYKEDGGYHEQERDVSKKLRKESVTISLFGLEQQTKAEKFMPVRVIGYDGQSYRAQIVDRKAKRIYPVVTVILYFGMNHWNYSRHLKELLDLPEEFEPFVSDYEVKNLFEIAYLPPEQVKTFKSDFRYVADYFVQMRTTKEYTPAPDLINHVDATLKMMSVLTGNRKFEEKIPELKDKDGGVSMVDVFEKVETKARTEGRTEGRIEGRLEGMVMVYYNDLGLTPEQIAVKVGKPVSEITKIVKGLGAS